MMKNIMILLFSLVCTLASYAEANTLNKNAPLCPSVSKVVGISFEDAMYYGGEYDYVAYYDDLLHLGTPSLWYEAAVNLMPELDKGHDKIAQILAYAKDNVRYIDIQVNERAVIDSLYGIQLYVCYYKSSNPKIHTRVITATPLENGYLLNARTQEHVASGLVQLKN
jgi:hypothetical protein